MIAEKTQQIPYSNEYEQAVLGSVLYDPAIFEDVKEMIAVDDFYNPEHQDIFRAMKKLHAQHQIVDVVALGTTCDPGYVAELTMQTPETIHIDFYCQKLKSLSIARDFVEKCGGYREELSKDPYQVESKISEMMHDLQSYDFGQKGFVNSISDEMKEVVELLEKTKGQDLLGLKTGVHDFDRKFLGVQPGLWVIAGRPHMGKTTFAVRMAYQIAKHGGNVLFAPLEDGADTMTKRLIAMNMGIHYKALVQGYYDTEKFYKVAGELSNMPLSFTKMRFDADYMRNYVKRNIKNIDALFIDQISHVKLDFKGGGGDYRIFLNDAIRKIKQIAVDFKIPVFLLAQISRKVEDRQNKRPTLADLKETGNLEEDADVIAMVYRDKYYNSEKGNDLLEVITPKNKISDDLDTMFFRETKGKLEGGRAAL